MTGHYFPGMELLPRSDYFAPEADPQTDVEVVPTTATHYFPSTPVGLDINDDNVVDGLNKTALRVAFDWAIDTQPLIEATDNLSSRVSYLQLAVISQQLAVNS